MPNPDYKDWNCKYQIFLNKTILAARKSENKPLGFIYIQTEQYGFDEEVNILVMPNSKFIDYVEG